MSEFITYDPEKEENQEETNEERPIVTIENEDYPLPDPERFTTDDVVIFE